MPRPSSSIWEHYLTLCDSDGKKHVACSYCSVQYRYAMANKLKQHILKCDKCPNRIKKKYMTDEIYKNYQSSSASVERLTSLSPDIPQRERSTNVCNNHEDIDIALARAIYASGAPLSLLESEHWQKVFRLFDSSYTVPTRHALSNPLLEAEYSRIKNEIHVKLENSLALSLICDSWTNIIGKGAINFIVTAPEPIFYHAIYPETQLKSGEFISCSEIIKIINDIGPHKFVTVVTDNSANMRAAWTNINTEFPHISCIACASHSLNLIYKDIFENIGFFKELLQKIVCVIKYIKRTNVVLALLEKYQIEKLGVNVCPLILFSKTRWSGAYITLESYKKNRKALELLAKSHKLAITPEIKHIILDNQIWLAVDGVINILHPLAMAIISSEKDKALLSDVPIIFQNLCQDTTRQLDDIMFLDDEDKTALLESIDHQKEMCLQPIHFAAHQLDPRYCGNGLSDEEISKASQYIRQYCAINSLDEAKTLSSMAEFKLKVNFFEETKAIWALAKVLEPRLWWQTLASNQTIAAIAGKILSLPSSSVASEINWSLYARSHTKMRNSLKQSRVLKLVSIRSNLNLLYKKKGVTFYDESDEDDESEDPQSEPEMLEETDPLNATYSSE